MKGGRLVWNGINGFWCFLLYVALSLFMVAGLARSNPRIFGALSWLMLIGIPVVIYRRVATRGLIRIAQPVGGIFGVKAKKRQVREIVRSFSALAVNLGCQGSLKSYEEVERALNSESAWASAASERLNIPPQLLKG